MTLVEAEPWRRMDFSICSMSQRLGVTTCTTEDLYILFFRARFAAVLSRGTAGGAQDKDTVRKLVATARNLVDGSSDQ